MIICPLVGLSGFQIIVNPGKILVTILESFFPFSLALVNDGDLMEGSCFSLSIVDFTDVELEEIGPDLHVVVDEEDQFAGRREHAGVPRLGCAAVLLAQQLE